MARNGFGANVRADSCREIPFPPLNAREVCLGEVPRERGQPLARFSRTQCLDRESGTKSEMATTRQLGQFPSKSDTVTTAVSGWTRPCCCRLAATQIQI